MGRKIELKKIDEYRWMIPKSYMPGMRVPGMLYADREMLPEIERDNALQQVANAAHLAGVVRNSIAMPDIHWGYGFPIGGVLATDIEKGGIVTPGGIGYDINCGVRLLRTGLAYETVKTRVRELVELLYNTVPSGVGSSGKLKLDLLSDPEVLVSGAGWAVREGYGNDEDLINCEERGAFEGADPTAVSRRALERGSGQLGTLGSGNHFVEIQVVDEIYDARRARVFGISEGELTVMVHTGSRGFGHQICTEYASRMQGVMGKYGLQAPDRQLACVPVNSDDGRAYLSAMRCAANYAWANRQVITHLIRKTLGKFFGGGEGSRLELVYDVAHNIAKIESYVLYGEKRKLCVHRKGATRAFPPGSEELPERYRDHGQPVIIPGDMGRYSFLLSGTETGEEAFYSTAHGAGRFMSRTHAKKTARGRDIAGELAGQGICVRSAGRNTLKEEMPEAYKDVTKIVNVVENAKLARKVARLRPLGVCKG